MSDQQAPSGAAYAMASQLLANGRWAEALPLLEELIAGHPQIPQLRVAAGQCRQRLLLGEDLLGSCGLNQKRYQRWIAYGEDRLPDPLLPLRQDWWELTEGPQAAPCWKPLHGGSLHQCAGWPPFGWLVLRHPGCELRAGALQAVELWLQEELELRDQDPHLIYGDEDRLSSEGERCDPWFKPGYSEESFWSSPWLEGLSLWRISWLRWHELPAPPLDLERRWLWILNALTHAPRTQAVPQVLSHWLGDQHRLPPERMSRRAVELCEHLRREGERIARVVPHAQQAQSFQLQWALPPQLRCRVVIPTRDRADLLEACLQSLWRTRGLATDALHLEIVVVDNGSEEDSTFALFRRWQLQLGEQFRVQSDDRAFNWSSLNNAAIADADADLLLFLNNDIEALESGWLEAMARQAMRPQVGCVGAVLLYPDGTIQHAGVVVGMHGGADHAYSGLPYPCAVHRGRSQLLTNWGAVTGACLMVRRALFLQAGCFDEAFPVEFNDIEFCLRLGQLGLRHVVVPEAVLIHHESQSRDAQASATARDALQRLQHAWNVQLSSTAPWWPAACAPNFADGRPLGLELYL